MGRRPKSTTNTPWLARPLGVALVCLAVGVSMGQSSAPTAASRVAASQQVLDSLSRRGDLTLRDATLENALFTISELWGVNIVAAKVEGSVNGVFKDAPLRDILDTILLSNGFAYRPVGGSLVVSRLEALGQINPFFVSETIPVGVSDVDEVVEAAKLMSTPQGQIRPLPTAGAILVVDFPDRVEMIRDLIKQLDTAGRGVGSHGVGPRQLEVAYFRTHFVPAADAAQALEVVLSAEGRSAPVDGDDRLLVVDYPENIRMVESVLTRLDRPRPQVNIKALIYDISLSDMEQIGVNWGGVTNGAVDANGAVIGKNKSGMQVAAQTISPLASTANGGAFTFYALEGNFNLQSMVVALQQAEDSRLLADPNVTVMDNEPAKIESISEIPFQQLTQTTGGGNIGTTAFKEVGIKLDVVPKIARDATIDLTVIPEFSRLAGYTPETDQPIIETRRATTRVRVANSQTIMIAGLRQRSDVGNFNGVPLLKDVRYIGRLFRSHDTQIRESELVVFLTPEIVGYNDCLDERDRVTADTIRCRLDRVPPAEGCPHCNGTAPCDCENAIVDHALTPYATPEYATSEYAAPESPTDVTPEHGPDSHEVLPSPPASADPVETVDPIGRASSASDKSQADLRRSVRRLPPATRVAVAYATPLSDSPRAGESEPEVDQSQKPMRIDYDSRFRAPGSVNPNRERLFADPAPPLEKQAENKSFWQFWR
ncbi:secretin N-terminal domain-containing protein [Botrimarina mediterranea]|uniref:Type II secretion system protein D n=1 Tax=Botrimarina mediterranea TaxID=2528022 RepID=A0A518K8K3_9BACT|nr:secretin N-terminal domain-containing protein [Botrimarina mediterranea]QDV74126.1 Type II secretion system protein D precursor [Botrimarina mediterranea]